MYVDARPSNQIVTEPFSRQAMDTYMLSLKEFIYCLPWSSAMYCTISRRAQLQVILTDIDR